MEIRRTKNVATIIAFPIVDADGDIVTGATALDSEMDAWSDGAAPDGFADCTNEATEIGTTGIYYLSLTQTEMNNDYIYIQVKTTSSGAKTQHILINTTPQVANATQISGDSTAADNCELFFDGTGYAAANSTVGTVTTLTNANPTAASVADAVWDEASTGHVDAGKAGEQLWTDLDAVLVDTAALNDTKVPDTISLANINAEADTALADINLDHLVGTATGIPAIPAGTFIDQIMDDGTAAFDRTTDSLQAIRDTAPLGTAMRGTDSAALASVCTEARLAELDAANIPAGVDAILVDTGTSGVIVASGGIGSGAHAAAELNAIADSILDRNMTTGTDSGSPTVRTSRQALRLLRNKASIAAGTLTCRKEDDATTSWTATVTTTAGNPISEIDPA